MSTKTQQLSIARIIRETPDAVTLQLAVPEHLKEDFNFLPGQYITLVFEIDGKEERRAYSMSSSPWEDDISVTVKKVEQGLVSVLINDELKEGAKVKVIPPQGHFFAAIDSDNQKCYYLFGAGSGITPLMSVISSVLKQEPNSRLFLLYGNRTEEGIIFRKRLDELVQKYQERFQVHYLLTEPPKKGGFFGRNKTTWDGGVGRINEHSVNEFLQQNPCVMSESEYFICGPGQMIDQVEEVLRKRGIDKKYIHFERFTSSQTKKVLPQSDVVDGASLIVHLDDERIECSVPKGKTILEALLKNNIDAPFACKSGVCSSCIAKLKNGEVSMDSSEALDEDEIKHGYILTCQARPKSSVVEIDFDDL